MINNEIIVKHNKIKIADYLKQISFIVLFVMMALLLNSREGGFFENIFTVIGFIILIILIPINQIFRIKRIHIYEMYLDGDLKIHYQDLLRNKEIQLSIRETETQNLKTNIRGCSLLKISDNIYELNQYCNKYWTNELIEKVSQRLQQIKDQEA
jgi:hypothetical protein